MNVASVASTVRIFAYDIISLPFGEGDNYRLQRVYNFNVYVRIEKLTVRKKHFRPKFLAE